MWMSGVDEAPEARHHVRGFRWEKQEKWSHALGKLRTTLWKESRFLGAQRVDGAFRPVAADERGRASGLERD